MNWLRIVALACCGFATACDVESNFDTDDAVELDGLGEAAQATTCAFVGMPTPDVANPQYVNGQYDETAPTSDSAYGTDWCNEYVLDFTSLDNMMVLPGTLNTEAACEESYSMYRYWVKGFNNQWGSVQSGTASGFWTGSYCLFPGPQIDPALSSTVRVAARAFRDTDMGTPLGIVTVKVSVRVVAND